MRSRNSQRFLSCSPVETGMSRARQTSRRPARSCSGRGSSKWAYPSPRARGPPGSPCQPNSRGWHRTRSRRRGRAPRDSDAPSPCPWPGPRPVATGPQSIRILNAAKPWSRPRRTSATILSGVFSNPAPTLQYSGMSVRAAPPSRAWIGRPACLPDDVPERDVDDPGERAGGRVGELAGAVDQPLPDATRAGAGRSRSAAVE